MPDAKRCVLAGSTESVLMAAARDLREGPRGSLLRAYLRATEAVTEEVDRELRIAEGKLPETLRGVLYRNGPGKMDVFGAKYEHPFDGDGMVTRFSFDGRAVRYRNRFVRTREYVAEESARRMLFRSFGTNLPGGLRRNFLRLAFKNAANTSVVLHAGKLLALWEGGLPHALDPETLETLGRHDFDGKLQNRTGVVARLISPELPFSAHPKRDAGSAELINFGTLLGRENKIVSYRVRKDGSMAEPAFLPLPTASFVHDFILTPGYAVYFLSAVSFRVAPTLFGLATPVGSLTSSRDAPATLLFVPRDGRPPLSVAARPGFIFHFANGFEDREGRVILDGMRMDTLPSAELVRAFLAGEDVKLPPTLPTRYVADLSSKTVAETPLTSTPADLPTIDPCRTGLEYRHFWAVAAQPGRADPFYQNVLHFEHDRPETVRDFAPDFPGEPLFVARPPETGHDRQEGEGWVLCLVYRVEAHRTDLYVLRAGDLGTVCRLELPHHVPPGFHGTWCPEPSARLGGEPEAGGDDHQRGHEA